MKHIILYDIFEAKCLSFINEIIKLETAGEILAAAKLNRELALYRIDYYEQFLNEPYKPYLKIYQTQYDNAWKLLGAVNDIIYDIEHLM